MCLLKVLCPVRRPITTLDYILLKDTSKVEKKIVLKVGDYIGK
jgi:hypothetical protein